MFYGDRSAGVQDPSGNYWWISTHIEDLSTEELLKRASLLVKRSRSEAGTDWLS